MSHGKFNIPRLTGAAARDRGPSSLRKECAEIKTGFQRRQVIYCISFKIISPTLKPLNIAVRGCQCSGEALPAPRKAILLP